MANISILHGGEHFRSFPSFLSTFLSTERILAHTLTHLLKIDPRNLKIDKIIRHVICPISTKVHNTERTK